MFGINCRILRPSEKVYIFYDFVGTKVDPQAFVDRTLSYLGEDMFLTKFSKGRVTLILR